MADLLPRRRLNLDGMLFTVLESTGEERCRSDSGLNTAISTHLGKEGWLIVSWSNEGRSPKSGEAAIAPYGSAATRIIKTKIKLNGSSSFYIISDTLLSL